MDFSIFCPHCKHYQEFSQNAFEPKACVQCQGELFPHATDLFKETNRLNQCPHCGAAHLYRQKDFNQKLGIGLLVLGIGLAFFTYGLSLLAVTLFDLWLYRKVAEVGCCYRCHSQFRNATSVQQLEPFNLELYDYYRNLK